MAALKSEYGLLIGLTTTGDNQIEVLKKALNLEVNGISLFDVFQVTYNIFDQHLATCLEQFVGQNKRLVIKEALANGRVFPNEKYPHYAVAYNKLSELAESYQVGVDAIALRFCMDSIPAFKVLSGAATEQHLIDNLKAESFRLKEVDVQALKDLAISPKQYWKERKQLAWN